MKIIDKPWGAEYWWANEPDKYLGKILFVRAEQHLSIQHHKEKTETMMLLSGFAKLHIYNDKMDIAETLVMRPREPFTIHPGWTHSVEAITDCEILEVSTYHPDDVVRLGDKYGRETVK